MLHLILHFDINETILIGDDAGGDTFEQCINKIIAKSAFVKVPSTTTTTTNSNGESLRKTSENAPLSQEQRKYTLKVVPTHWLDGSPIRKSEVDETNSDTPASFPRGIKSSPQLWTQWEWPNNACPYYRTSFKKRSDRFIQEDGLIYKSYYQIIYKKLHPNRWNKTNAGKRIDQGDAAFTTGAVNESCATDAEIIHNNDKTQRTMAQMLPAFFNTLISLQEWCHHQSSSSVHQHPSPLMQNITIVLRTFGTDLPLVMNAIQRFVHGQHPDYPNVPHLHGSFYIPSNGTVRGRWIQKVNGACASRFDIDQITEISKIHQYEYELLDGNNNVIVSGDENVVQWLHALHIDDKRSVNTVNEQSDNNTERFGNASQSYDNLKQQQQQPIITICGIQDDYEHWSKHNCVPWAGKPIWKLLTKDGISSHPHTHYHHVLFDDNMYVATFSLVFSLPTYRASSFFLSTNRHNLEHDSIACVREEVKAAGDGQSNGVSSSMTFRTLSGRETLQEQGRHIIRVPTIEPIFNPRWFIEQIESMLLLLQREQVIPETILH
jgi:hypothetical protein